MTEPHFKTVLPFVPPARGGREERGREGGGETEGGERGGREGGGKRERGGESGRIHQIRYGIQSGIGME